MNTTRPPRKPLRILVNPDIERKLASWARREYQSLQPFLQRLIVRAIREEEDRLGCSLMETTCVAYED